MPEEDISEFMSRAKEKRKQEQDRDIQTDIPHSEYNKIIMLCHSYFQAFIESYSGQPMMIRRRNRIFQAIELLGRFRKDLPSVDEYFGDRPVGVFDKTIAEFEALEYVNVVQTKVMQMQDPRVDVGTLDDELSPEENLDSERERRGV